MGPPPPWQGMVCVLLNLIFLLSIQLLFVSPKRNLPYSVCSQLFAFPKVYLCCNSVKILGEKY